jgi:hypothetical protein
MPDETSSSGWNNRWADPRRTPTMHKTQLLGTSVWVTSMPSFFGSDSKLVIETQTTVPDWFDERLIPESDREQQDAQQNRRVEA